MSLSSACPNCCNGKFKKRQKILIMKVLLNYDVFCFESTFLFYLKKGWSFFPIALHEIGHLLGLDHSESYDSVMYATADNRRIILQEDDVRGITCLYGDQICEEFQFARNPAFSKKIS